MSDAGVTQPPDQQIVKVAIIEDVRSLREGFWMLIDGTPGFHCTGSFRTMEEALDKIGFDLPDVVTNPVSVATPPATRTPTSSKIVKSGEPVTSSAIFLASHSSPSPRASVNGTP